MTLITTNRSKFTKVLGQAIADLKAAMPNSGKIGAAKYFKFYEGVKGLARNGSKETFQIAASSEYKNNGHLVIMVALAKADSSDRNRFKENDITRLAKEMCVKAGARIHFYGYDSRLDRRPEKEPHCWLITAMWEKP